MATSPASLPIKILALALISLVCLGLLESGARILARLQGVPQQDLRFDWQTTLYVPHPYIGYTLRPNYDRSPYKDGSLHINALGYRGAEIPLRKPPRTLRLVCLGGSTTFSIEVGDQHTYPYLLETLLRATYPQWSLEVVNAGVGAYTSAESLANLLFRVLDLEPDALIIYHAVNDVHPRVVPGFKPDYSHYRKALVLPDTGLVNALSHVSTFVSLLRHIFAAFHIRHLTTLQKMEDIPQDQQWRNFQQTDAATFRRNIGLILESARARRIAVILSTFVYSATHLRNASSLSFEAYTTGIAQHNEVMRELSASYGVPLLDLAALFPSHELALFDDYVHFTIAGSKLQAQIFHDALVSTQVIEHLARTRFPSQ